MRTSKEIQLLRVRNDARFARVRKSVRSSTLKKQASREVPHTLSSQWLAPNPALVQHSLGHSCLLFLRAASSESQQCCIGTCGLCQRGRMSISNTQILYFC